MGRVTGWATLVLLCLFSLGVWAQSDKAAYPLDSAADRERFQTLTKELRCPKCQNQSIADSNAPISSDMRKQVYQRVKAGQSNEMIMEAMVSRFGEFVRYRPPFDQRTVLLWLTPLIVVLIGLGAVILVVVRSRGKQTGGPVVSEAERHRLDVLLADDSANHDPGNR
jgi:cytochrome c-type biogenesis protein CcmH